MWTDNLCFYKSMRYLILGTSIGVHKTLSRISTNLYILLTIPRRYFFCRSFVLFLSCMCHAFASVLCCLVVTCWKRTDVFDLVCGVKMCFCWFSMWYPGSGVVLDCIDSS